MSESHQNLANELARVVSLYPTLTGDEWEAACMQVGVGYFPELASRAGDTERACKAMQASLQGDGRCTSCHKAKTVVEAVRGRHGLK